MLGQFNQWFGLILSYSCVLVKQSLEHQESGQVVLGLRLIPSTQNMCNRQKLFYVRLKIGLKQSLK